MPTIPTMVPDAASTHEYTHINSPYDDSVIASVEIADSNVVEKALHTASQLFDDRENWLTLSHRISILKNACSIMEARAESLALQAAQEGGKPLRDSRVEVARAIDGINISIETMRTSTGHMIPMSINPASENKTAFTSFEPIGVVVAVSAFNHPLNLIVHQVVPAIAAGCPVIVKPSRLTPLSCFSFVKILREAGLPEKWCQALLPADVDTTQMLVTDTRVSFLSFIGSAKTGWMLRSLLSPGTRCALEHGGVAPVIIAQDADMTDAIPKLAKGGFYHAGQVCVSVQKVFVHASQSKKFLDALSAATTKLIVGDPMLEETDIGPIISNGEVDRIDQWVKDAVSQGATLICGGEKISSSCYECTILFNPAESSTVSENEIFGPVVCVYEYENIDEAISRANRLPYAFQASVFTSNINTAMSCAKSLKASSVMINDHTAFRVDWMPFAGLNQSGLGVGGIPHTIKDMQVEKMLVINS